MHLFVNGKYVECGDRTALSLRDSFAPGCEIIFINRNKVSGDVVLEENDRITFANVPSENSSIANLITERCPGSLRECVNGITVGIAGCGGLGSNIAIQLARTGVTKMIIADYDSVELSNLNRQQFSLEHLGMLKTDALEAVIARINPDVIIRKHPIRVTRSNIRELFVDCDVVCEAMDDPVEKAKFLNGFLEIFPEKDIVCGIGMGGFGNMAAMTQRRLSEHITVCGDGCTGSENGLTAPRVSVCASLMADAVFQYILERRKNNDNRRSCDRKSAF